MRAASWALAGCACLAVAAAPKPQGEGGLTENRRLAAVYDTILQARFQDVDAQLSQTCPPAPAEACGALRVAAAWWQIQIDPDSRRFDTRFNQLAAASIAASAAWTKREPARAEAWFYLAGSYAPLVNWRVLRGQHLAAAREGKTIKDALERALTLDPRLQDAHFGIGLYHYYADVAPAAAKLLRLLLLLPGGDRVEGLREMRQARDQGEILNGEASFQIQQLYLWYEHKPKDALEILTQLDASYPHNPLFTERMAEAEAAYLNDHAASAALWEKLIRRAAAGTVYDSRRTEILARSGLARERNAMKKSSF